MGNGQIDSLLVDTISYHLEHAGDGKNPSPAEAKEVRFAKFGAPVGPSGRICFRLSQSSGYSFGCPGLAAKASRQSGIPIAI
jgi:hypothetical protein